MKKHMFTTIAITVAAKAIFLFCKYNDDSHNVYYNYFDLLGRVSTDNVSLTKILCHRNFGNEFVFTNSKDYLYYLARPPLSQIFDNETSPQN